MSLTELFVIAVGLAIDAFVVAMACGFAFHARHHAGALSIALSFGAFQAGMPILGWLGGRGVRTYVEAFDHWIAFALLGYVGGRMIAGAFGSEPLPVKLAPPPPRTLLMLSIATSIDAFAVGLSLAMIAADIKTPAIVIGAVTFVMSFLGIVIGFEFKNVLPRVLRRALVVFGGVLLIGIGVRVLIEHLSR